ncbi:Phosphoglycerate dehydrogenase [Cryobacterium psychrotolerans]|uniref:Phosphoglycerate dehydrogenase n=1 Tax=Cryobacterium psychrotolerans TaxID=386301 RepID=A0A1G9G062_9MICO|nr:D-isomer specific 2-hydroxyacid dehydrogenase family protein [Cryobacterium psychrotolerans]TFD89325.1 hydroxyacid dehydrogenase [Cryobacterium psychrotolerans]SDK94010.1 Phosphoglycerate dehydrogenase [Cryobacterium psychrotolerans]
MSTDTETVAQATTVRLTGQHRAVLAGGVTALPPAERPTPGPIAVLPTASGVFAAAVRDAGGQVAELSAETRGLIWLSYSRADDLGATLAANPQIEWVQLPWAGVDGFSGVLAAQARPRLLWTSAKGAYAQPVAEHALALTLALLRVLQKRARAANWNAVPEGSSLYGRNIVIIGAGGIALELIRLIAPFGAVVTVVRRIAAPVPGAARTVQTDALHDVLPDADVVVVAAALTAGTRQLLGAEEFALMPAHANLVNVGRGALVDTDALVAALAAGEIAGAALDVTDPEPLPDGHPLWSEPRCLVTPHMADTPEMTAPLLAERIRLNTRAFLDDGRFVGVVDPRSGY